MPPNVPIIMSICPYMYYNIFIRKKSTCIFFHRFVCIFLLLQVFHFETNIITLILIDQFAEVFVHILHHIEVQHHVFVV